jgi:hypothetical protein
MPPLMPTTSSSLVDSRAPLAKWSTLATYGTRSECEAGKALTPSISTRCIADSIPSAKATPAVGVANSGNHPELEPTAATAQVAHSGPSVSGEPPSRRVKVAPRER